MQVESVSDDAQIIRPWVHEVEPKNRVAVSRDFGQLVESKIDFGHLALAINARCDHGFIVLFSLFRPMDAQIVKHLPEAGGKRTVAALWPVT